MCFPCHDIAARLRIALVLMAAALPGRLRAADDCCGQPAQPPSSPATQPAAALRVAADPNNLPFSNSAGEGFENKIAQLIADELHLPLEYRWMPQRLGFFRETLKNGDANVVMGVPAGFERALTTRPYYRSSYVFVARQNSPAASITGFDDAALAKLKIGVLLTGGVNTPPAHALGTRGLVNHLTGFPVFADSPDGGSSALISAVSSSKIDLAIAWGPSAGYFAGRETQPLAVRPVAPDLKHADLPMAFDICIGVKRQERGLRDQMNVALDRRQDDIKKILAEYHVPIVPAEAAGDERSAGEKGARP